MTTPPDSAVPSAAFGGHSMVAPLRRVLVCEPATAGWSEPGPAACWRSLGYPRPVDAVVAAAQHDAMVAALREAGVVVERLAPSPGLTLDATFPHDPSLVTDHGAILLRMGKPAREGEVGAHRAAFQALGVPVLGEVAAPGTAEGGDLLWLDPCTLLAGRGYRTNDHGVVALRMLLAIHGVAVVEAPLPHGSGPAACLHLMSLVSLLDETTALVDLPWLAASTVELLAARGYRLLEIDPDERASQAANVLALGAGRVLALAENPRTNRRLSAAGFEVLTFPGSELCQVGGGGPTCLTRPLLRR